VDFCATVHADVGGRPGRGHAEQGVVISREAGRFGVVGVLSALTYYLVYLVMQLVLPYLLAHAIAYAAAIVLSFFLNCHFTYRTLPTVKKFLLYPLTHLAGFLATSVGVTVLVEWAQVDERIAPIVAAGIAIPVSFVISRRILTGRRFNDRQAPHPSLIRSGT
jgi:putative flippase GtrA